MIISSEQQKPMYTACDCFFFLHTVSFHVLSMVCKVPVVLSYSAHTLGTGVMRAAWIEPVLTVK